MERSCQESWIEEGVAQEAGGGPPRLREERDRCMTANFGAIQSGTSCQRVPMLVTGAGHGRAAEHLSVDQLAENEIKVVVSSMADGPPRVDAAVVRDVEDARRASRDTDWRLGRPARSWLLCADRERQRPGRRLSRSDGVTAVLERKAN